MAGSACQWTGCRLELDGGNSMPLSVGMDLRLTQQEDYLQPASSASPVSALQQADRAS